MCTKFLRSWKLYDHLCGWRNSIFIVLLKFRYNAQDVQEFLIIPYEFSSGSKWPSWRGFISFDTDFRRLSCPSGVDYRWLSTIGNVQIFRIDEGPEKPTLLPFLVFEDDLLDSDCEHAPTALKLTYQVLNHMTHFPLQSVTPDFTSTCSTWKKNTSGYQHLKCASHVIFSQFWYLETSHMEMKIAN